MSELGKIIADRIDPPNLDAEDVKAILDALSDLGSRRRNANKVVPDREIDDAILEWANDHFNCTLGNHDEHERYKLEWA